MDTLKCSYANDAGNFQNVKNRKTRTGIDFGEQNHILKDLNKSD